MNKPVASTERLEERKTLLQISTGIASTLQEDAVANLLADGLIALIEYDTMAIYMADHAQHKLRPILVKGREWPGKQDNDAWSIPYGQGIIGSIIHSAKGEMINDAHLDARTVYPTKIQIQKEQLIAIPLKMGSQCWGALALNRLADKHFQSDEFETAQFLASYASLALNNIKLLAEVHEKKRVLRSLLDAIPDKPLKVDKEGNILEKTGAHPVTATHLTDIYQHEVAEQYLASIVSALQRNRNVTFEFQIKHNEDLSYFEARTVPLSDTCCLLLTRDITEAKRTRALLRDEQALKEVTFDTLSDGLITINQEGHIIYCNEITGKIFGYTRQELLHKPLTHLIPTTLRERHERSLQQYHETGQKNLHSWQGLELPGLHKDGFEIPLEVSFGETVVDGKRIFTGTLRNISERKKAEEALKSTSTRLENLIKTIQAGVLVEDENRKVVLCNQRFCDMFFIPAPADALVGMDCSQSAEQTKHYFADPDHFVSRINDVLANRQVVVNEEMQMDNGLAYARDYVPIFIDEKYRGHLWLYRDITENKKVELDLIKAKKQAEESTKAKQDFLARMSHELRTPINGVLGLANLLMNTQQTKENVEYLNGIRTSGEHLLAIINDILDLSKIEAGKLEIESIAFDARQITHDLLKGLKISAEQKGIELFVELEENIPSVLVGDPVRFNQVMMNLMSNAIKFTEHGFVKLEINAKHELQRCWLCMTVTDTGIGIPSDKLEAIFERFTQADSSTSIRFGGTGLGLTIVKQLVEMQGGTLTVKSEIGKGSEFVVSIPYTISAADLELDVKEEHHLLRYDGSNVLVAEDNLINQLVAKRTLENWGIDVTLVNNGLEAIRELQSNKSFDLVIMDVQMPEMDGFQATQIIRNQLDDGKRSIPIIAMTASVLYDPKARALTAGMNDYISKPFKPEQLNEKLKPYLKSKAQVFSQATSRQEKLIDFDYLESISPGNDEFKREMIDLFDKQSQHYLTEIKKCFIDGQFRTLGRQAHAFKPLGSYIGVQSLTQLLQQLEIKTSEVGDVDEMAGLIAQIEIMITEIKQEIDHLNF